MTENKLLPKVQATLDEFRSVVGTFLTEFAAFETYYLSAALRALSHDATLVGSLEDLMDLEKRLRLLKRLAEAQGLPNELMNEVKSARTAAKKLLEHRNEVAHGAGSALTGYGVRDPESIGLGVNLPKSKHRMPPAGPITEEESMAILRSRHRTVPEIRGYIDKTQELQSMMRELTDKLSKQMRAKK